MAGSELLAAPDVTLAGVFKISPSGLSAPHRVKARSCGGPDTLSGAKQANAVGVWGRHAIGLCHRVEGRARAVIGYSDRQARK